MNNKKLNTELQDIERETFSSKYGFILACIGSAMGLSNIWMFPYRLGKYGGAAFLIPYLIFLFGFANFGLMGEFAFGRSQQNGPVGAFSKVFKSKGKNYGGKIGIIPVIGVTGVFIFYLIVSGWIINFFILAITNSFKYMNIENYFQNFAGTSNSIPWHILALLITALIVNLGVQKGIEKSNKYMMTMFYIVLAIVLIRVLTLKGAGEGVKFLLVPDWSKLLNLETWIMGLGMAFFTLCLGGAGMVIYGSYLKKDEDIPDAAWKTSIFDTLAAMMSAFVTIPAAFAFGLNPQSGPKLLFITLPNVFNNMPGGYIFGVLFFLCVIFASISSAVNMIEVPVEALMDKFKFSRTKSVALITLLAFLIGLPLDLNMSVFGKFSDLFSVLILPSGAVLAAVVYYWIHGVDKAREEINKGTSKPIGKWLEPFLKYIFTPVALIILVAGYVLGGF